LETKKGMMKIENDLQKQHGGCIIGANILPPLISKLFKYLVGKIKRCNVCKIYIKQKIISEVNWTKIIKICNT
jgi:hypothetical protein